MADLAMDKKPGVVLWFKIYCGFMVVVCTVFVAGGAWVVFGAPGLVSDPGVAIFMLAATLLTAVAYLAALFLRPSPWAWMYHLTMIALGLFGLVTALGCIPLLIFWFKKETRAYYGRS